MAEKKQEEEKGFGWRFFQSKTAVFLIALPILFHGVYGMVVFWMGKQSLFRWPFGPFFRWLGGVAIDRSKSNDVVAQTVDAFRRAECFVLGVAPEGTRKRVAHWKTGFYRIAEGAGVPIALGFLDYRRKVGGIGPLVRPSGNLAEDMQAIRRFYGDITGYYSAESALASVESESAPSTKWYWCCSPSSRLSRRSVSMVYDGAGRSRSTRETAKAGLLPTAAWTMA